MLMTYETGDMKGWNRCVDIEDVRMVLATSQNTPSCPSNK